MSSDILEEAFYQNIAVKWCSRLSELLNRMVNVTTQLAEPRQEAALQPLVQPSHIQSVVSPVKTERSSSGVLHPFLTCSYSASAGRQQVLEIESFV